MPGIGNGSAYSDNQEACRFSGFYFAPWKTIPRVFQSAAPIFSTMVCRAVVFRKPPLFTMLGTKAKLRHVARQMLYDPAIKFFAARHPKFQSANGSCLMQLGLKFSLDSVL